MTKRLLNIMLKYLAIALVTAAVVLGVDHAFNRLGSDDSLTRPPSALDSLLGAASASVSTLLVAFGLIGGGPIAANANEESAPGQAETYAVLFYADWCGSCKTLDPRLEEARASLADEPVLFVTFDMTDENTTRQTGMLAKALHLGEPFSENAGKTGFLLLIDAESHDVVDRITTEDSTEDIESKIAAAATS